MESNNIVAFCGPIASRGKPAVGGHQACNRRTIDALAKRDFSIFELPYPTPDTHGLKKFVDYSTGFLKLILDLAIKVPKKPIFHLTGFYKQFIYVEIVLVLIALARRLPVIYDIRAGAMLYYYRSRGPVYRWVFKKLVRMADVVMIEGLDYLDFIRSITGEAPHYFPNHVENLIVKTDDLDSRVKAEKLRLIYLGRLTPEKGIEKVLDASVQLEKEGFNLDLNIVGTGNEEYVESLKEKYNSGDVYWRGPLSNDRVLEEFSRSHFFLFPTKHLGEGHSNALTEAMASGCVPIASDSGFNLTVIDDAGRILALEASGNEYASVIQSIWTSGQWEALSQRARDRFQNHYATSSVIDKLLPVYANIAKCNSKP